MPSARKPIVVVGSINIDLVAGTEKIPVQGETVLGHSFQIHPGGKGANQAVAVGRLGYPVRMIGRLGDDAFGAQLRSHMEDAGVEMSGVGTSEASSSGVALIVVARSGENSIVIAPGANAFVTPEYVESHLDILRSAGIVLAQLEIPLETVECLANLCAKEKVPLILDPAPARELPPSLLRSTAWFTPNETEAAFFLGGAQSEPEKTSPAETARLLRARGAQGVVLKLGARGAYLESVDGRQEFIESFKADAIDTTAAGDAFNGAFAAGLMLGMTPSHAARFAAAAASISVKRVGAQPSMPAMHEVEEVLAQAQPLVAAMAVQPSPR
jgi:ribokinase